VPDLIHVYAGDLLTKARNDDGTITVYGKAAGPDLDNDQQILDPGWLAREMPAWFQQWGNIREMHQAKAIGKAIELDAKDDDYFLTARIVDPDAIRKVEEGVLTGWSVGIKRPRIQRDSRAAGGRVIGGKIVENSLVDNACNETCKLVLAKVSGADKPGELEAVEELHDAGWRVQLEEYLGKAAKVNELLDAGDVDAAEALWQTLQPAYKPDPPEPDALKVLKRFRDRVLPGGFEDGVADLDELEMLLKRDVSTAERERLAGRGQAMPGGGFPIANVADLKNAIRAIGRAKDRAATIAHIKRRARALGRTDLIPDAWKAELPDLAKFTAADIQGAIKAICDLIVEEARDLGSGDTSELWDITNLLEAVRCLVTFWQGEAREGTVTPPGEEDDTMPLSLTQIADLAKAATADDASDEDKQAWAEMTKALGLATLPEQIAEATRTAVEEATKTVETTVDGLADKVADAAKTVVAEATKTVTTTVTGLGERVRKLEGQPLTGGPARTTTIPDVAKSARADTLRDQASEYRRLADTLNGDPNGRAGLLTLAEKAERELAALT
jgi:hypothetical protein